MEQSKREELRKAAEAATPGPWAVQNGGNFTMVWRKGSKYSLPSHNAIADVNYRMDEEGNSTPLQSRRNAAFIATANPQAVLDLLSSLTTETARADKAEAELAGQAEEIADYRAHDRPVAKVLRHGETSYRPLAAMAAEWVERADNAEAEVERLTALVKAIDKEWHHEAPEHCYSTGTPTGGHLRGARPKRGAN